MSSDRYKPNLSAGTSPNCPSSGVNSLLTKQAGITAHTGAVSISGSAFGRAPSGAHRRTSSRAQTDSTIAAAASGLWRPAYLMTLHIWSER